MKSAERLEEERSARRWLLAGGIAFASLVLLAGPYYLAAGWVHGAFGPDIGFAYFIGGYAAGGIIALAGTICLFAGAILHISSESRRG
jgi:hypothetical protein